MSNKPPWATKTFHYSYILIGLIFPLIALIWLLIPNKRKDNSFSSLVSRMFNHHEHEYDYSKCCYNGSLTRCKNKKCTVLSYGVKDQFIAEQLIKHLSKGESTCILK